MTLRRLSLLTVLLTACAPSVPRQEEAVRIVWNGVYERSGTPPELFWIVPPDLNCAKHGGQYQGWDQGPLLYSDTIQTTKDRVYDLVRTGPLTQCVAGITDTTMWFMEVAKPDNVGWQIHQSALSHELLHAYLFLKKGDSDVEHKDPEWNTLVPLANKLLFENGF